MAGDAAATGAMTDYSERDLVIPTLRLLGTNPEGLTTTEIIAELRRVLEPSGHDAETLPSRSDDRFSQKVRNLVSHDTLVDFGFATYASETSVHRITKEGIEHLETNDQIPPSPGAAGAGTDPTDGETASLEARVEEGTLSSVERDRRRRSRALRDAKIEQVRGEDGSLPCAVCGFDFGVAYGDHGEGFIEIHHLEPVHELDEAGEAFPVEEALDRLAPLCANCHRMVHRDRGQLLSLDELRSTLRSD